jgi:hypothetical protein
MGTSNRKRTNKSFTGSKLIVDGQGNNGVLRSNNNNLNNILKTPKSDSDSTTPPTTT